jgi:hypothetical protein
MYRHCIVAALSSRMPHQWSFCFNLKAARATVHQRQQEVIAMIDLVRTERLGVGTDSRMRLVSAQVLLASCIYPLWPYSLVSSRKILKTCLFLVVMGYPYSLDALTMGALACRDGVTLVQGVGAHNLCTESECQELVKLWEAKRQTMVDYLGCSTRN